MKRAPLYIASTLAVILSLAAWGISAAVDMPSTLMSPADYNAAKRGIETQTRITYARCRLHKEASREICRAEAKAAERVKIADLQAKYHGTVAAAEEARMAKVQASYDLARARCGIKDESKQQDCLQAARDQNARALADARLAAI